MTGEALTGYFVRNDITTYTRMHDGCLAALVVRSAGPAAPPAAMRAPELTPCERKLTSSRHQLTGCAHEISKYQ